MRKSTLVAVSAALLSTVALAACEFGAGNDEKADDAATEEGASEGGEGAGLGAKPDDEAGGAENGAGDEAGASGDSSGDAGAGGKPDEEGEASGGSGGGSTGESGGGSTGGSGGDPSEQEVVNHYTQQLDGYLDAYVEQYASGARSAGIRDVVVPLAAGTEHRWSINLEGGRNYGIFGACDEDCSDVDLIVEGPDGGELGRDVLLDDYPIVGFTAPSSGRYTVRIQLVTCEVEPCFVGARVVTE